MSAVSDTPAFAAGIFSRHALSSSMTGTASSVATFKNFRGPGGQAVEGQGFGIAADMVLAQLVHLRSRTIKSVRRRQPARRWRPSRSATTTTVTHWTAAARKCGLAWIPTRAGTWSEVEGGAAQAPSGVPDVGLRFAAPDTMIAPTCIHVCGTEKPSANRCSPRESVVARLGFVLV